MKNLKILSIISLFIFVISSCNSNENNSVSPYSNNNGSKISNNNNSQITFYTIGGYVLGLYNGETITISNNGKEEITLNKNTLFYFKGKVSTGTTYDVTIKTKPKNKICSVKNGKGVVKESNITNIVIECENTYSIGGYTVGLENGDNIIITNGSEDITLNENKTFSFSKKVSSGTSYDVKIVHKPDNKICTVKNGVGTVEKSNITDIVVECIQTYTIGGEVSGLVGILTISNNGYEIPITGPGQFTFPERYPGGSTYNVVVTSQPENQVCTVTYGSGTIAINDINNIEISCNYIKYQLGVNINGINGSIVIGDGNDVMSINSDGTYLFPTKISYLYPYSVTILAQPFYLSCKIYNGEGIIYEDTFSEITCESKKYSLGGIINNLYIGDLIIKNQYGEHLTFTSSGQFTFLHKYEWGSEYNLSIVQQPNHTICQITNPSGKIYTDITSITINCSEEQYSIGGTVTTLYEDSIMLTNNNENLEINSTGSFTFPTTQTYGTSYNVIITKYPEYQTCTIDNYSGTVTGNVNDIVVNCSYKYYSVGGTVINFISGELFIQNNLGEILKITSNGDFNFSTLFRDGTNYYVSVLTQPTGSQCGISNNSGSIYGANITDISIDCGKSLTLSGNITGTKGETIVLKNYGTFISLSTDGPFTFPNYYGSGEDYNVTIYSTPITYSCTISNGTGTFYNSNVTDIIVICTIDNLSGHLDYNFNSSSTPGYVTMTNTASSSGTGNGDTAWDVVIDSQNNIIVTGWSNNGSDLDMVVWKFKENGTLDNTFGQDNDGDSVPDGYDVFDAIAGYKQNDWGMGITITTDEKLFVTGFGKASSGNDDMVLIKLNSDGSFDTSFGNNGVVTHNNAAGGNKHDKGRDVVLDNNGNIIVAGESYFLSGNNYWTNVIWKYKPDGTLDATFNSDGIFVKDCGINDKRNTKGVVYSKTTNDIFVNGQFTTTYNDTTYQQGLFSVSNSDGNIENTDEPDSYAGMKLTLDKNGNVITTGKAYSSSMYIRYYNQDISSRNTAFDTDGILVYDNPNGGDCEGDDVVVDKNGKIIVVGYCYDGSHNAMTVWRYNPDGTLDTTFNDTGIFMMSGTAYGEGDDYAHGVAIDHKGRIVIVGESINSDSTAGMMAIWRILP